MKFSDIEERTANRLGSRLDYKYCYYIEFDFSILNNILARKKHGAHSEDTYAEVYIGFDTETSKAHEPVRGAFGRYVTQDNHICMWTIAIRAFHKNICTLRGAKPSELVHCVRLIRENIKATNLFLFAHNLPYDIVFLRRFFYKEFGYPVKQLNIRNHYPMTIKFKTEHGFIILRDSLILAGMSLEKWSKILEIGEHEKAVGFWNYDTIRNQQTFIPTKEELIYVEYDVLALVECLNKLADLLGDTVVSLPFTNTGIPRRDVRREGRKNYAKQDFKKQVGDYKEFCIQEKLFHGGFVHSNRFKNGIITKGVSCRDFKSSYPYSLLVCPMVTSAYAPLGRDLSIEDILDKSDNTGFMFKFCAENIRLIDRRYPMPALQYSKCELVLNPVKDNGRILRADYVEIWLNEIDARIIYDLYDYDKAICTQVSVATKSLLPRWFRDIVFNTFKEKCELEYKIKVEGQKELKPAYAQCKSRLNSLYGMSVTKPVKEQIIEVYEDTDKRFSGEYYYDSDNKEKDYMKYYNNRQEMLPYVWGIYTTSYSMLRIFELSKCIGDGTPKDLQYHYLYTDTDSIYSDKWNEEALTAFNEKTKQDLIVAGYGPVTIEDREFWLGIAEFDGYYDKFIAQGSKRYAGIKEGEIVITVAGVPKCGAKCLKSLDDFKEGFVFPGVETGKKMLTYIYKDIYIDDFGNECADSIDMNPCDYRLSVVENPLTMDQLILFNDDGTISINEFEEPEYDWFE